MIFNTSLFKKIILSISLIFSTTTFVNEIYSQEINKSEKLSYVSNNFNKITPYILGAGDYIKINFIGAEIFTGKYLINPDGFISLPEIGLINVEGITLQELKIMLVEKYSDIIINPEFIVSIERFRPINISIKGEVNRPGLYLLDYKKNQTSFGDSSPLNESFGNNPASFTAPKVFDALQYAEGFGPNADLENIVIIRQNSNSNGGGKIKTILNLIDILDRGDFSQNIILRDGDFITVNRTDKVLLDQIIGINKSNISPKEIRVFVNGNVPKTGSTIIRQNTTLNGAIAAVGGVKMNTRNIEFIRIQRDGKTSKRVFKYSKFAKRGELNNPVLIDGDIIIVNKNLIASFTEALDTVASPVITSYGLYKVFD